MREKHFNLSASYPESDARGAALQTRIAWFTEEFFELLNEEDSRLARLEALDLLGCGYILNLSAGNFVTMLSLHCGETVLPEIQMPTMYNLLTRVILAMITAIQSRDSLVEWAEKQVSRGRVDLSVELVMYGQNVLNEMLYDALSLAQSNLPHLGSGVTKDDHHG
jgi:hypothetical protein